MSFSKSLLLSLGIIITFCAHAQDPPQTTDTLSILSPSETSKYLDIVSSKANMLEHKLDKKSEKALQQMQKIELRMQRKLAKKDSLKSADIFGNAEQQYKQLEQRLEKKVPLQQYIPTLDTLSSSLKFLQQNPQLLSTTKEVQQKLKDAMTKVSGMEGKLQKAEEIKNFLKERKAYLKQQLQHLGFAKELKKVSKQTYYYSQQLNEYKALLKDHKKAERKALELLSKSKLFQNFMRKNSMLASLFRLPGDPNDPVNLASLAGLQTRAQVNNLIQQQIGTTGQAQFRANIQDAQSQFNQLKEKLLKVPSTGENLGEAGMPDGFKPNKQKTKSLFKRLELGINIQSQKASTFFPVASDIGLSIGYKLNDRSVVGMGASYRVGWGQNIRHIKITHQGVGFRSFVDWKIKGSFWLSGGYEMNYRSEIRSIEQLKDYSAWQKSGLLGLSKVVSFKTKFFKSTKLYLLYDMLSQKQIPRTPSFVFRIGYSLN